MAKRTRWVEYTMPVLVRVEIDDEYEAEEVTQVVLALGDEDPMFSLGRTRRWDRITLTEDKYSRATVYNGEPDADMAVVDDHWAREAVRVAEDRHWPARRTWEEGEHPADEPGCYDVVTDDDDEAGDVDGTDDDLEWTPLH